jgi:ketosteroid isomerase-like protein
MSDPTEAVIAANARFYRALGNADLGAMLDLWLHSDEAACVHPGWPLLAGWPAIRESWTAIFRNQGPMRVWPDAVVVRLEGIVAWVTCLENIDTSRQLTDVLAQAQATNLFRLVDGQWKLVLHHASPLPAMPGRGPAGGISPN